MATNYELLDFGLGKKLERFGDVIVQRRSLYADDQSPSSSDWPKRLSLSHLIFDHIKKNWEDRRQPAPATDVPWSVQFGQSTFLLKPTPAGQVGVFPEQKTNWDWIESELAPLIALRRNQMGDGVGASAQNVKALNLFAYTGGTTMALARAGAAVTHIDGAANVVRWAKTNAGRSGLASATIRWINEDVLKFMRRELKRGNRYDILAADPPSFGRGPRQETWKIERDLETLASLARDLMPNPLALVLSSHTRGFSCHRLADLLSGTFSGSGKITAHRLRLTTKQGRHLESGECARLISNQV